MTTTGILGYGVHLPTLRLPRERILAAHSWLAPSLAALTQGERTICNWDEDAFTMGVEAARAALAGSDRREVARLAFASTTSPYEDRLGAAVLTGALGLPSSVMPLDVGGSTRAGLTMLRSALEDGAAHAGTGMTLCVASDSRKARPASADEMLFGAGAAALVLGRGRVLARLLGAHSHTADFVDRFRARGHEFDFKWEDRWIRDQGHLRLIPEAVHALLARLGAPAEGVHHLVVPIANPGAAKAVAAAIGISSERLVDTHYANCGDIGTGYSLLLLIAALERARPGDRILVCAFGQGCDALLLEATDELSIARAIFSGVGAALARRSVETNYLRYLVGAGQLDVDFGLRGEVTRATPLSVAWRERGTLLAFIGGRCRQCGTRQFPRSAACVNPECRAAGEQDPVDFAEASGRVLTWTADHLASCLRPPVHYGMVEFEGGGRTLLELADADVAPPSTGMAVRMVFRLRRVDSRHGYRSYFWKASGAMAQ